MGGLGMKRAVHALRVFLIFLAAVVVWGGFSAPASAQLTAVTAASSGSDEPILPPPPSPNDTREFLRLLDDPSVRQWLKDSLSQTDADGDIEAQESFREDIRERISSIGERIQALGVAWQILPDVPDMLQSEWDEQISTAQKMRSVTYILIFILVGAGLEWLYRQNMGFYLLRLEQEPRISPLDKLKAATIRMGLLFAGW